MDGTNLAPQTITEFLAVAIASVAIVYGIGSTAWRGYRTGRCQLPSKFVWTVNSPLGIAMLLRIATFILDKKYYFFFIAIDAIGFMLAVIIQLQLFGFFLRKKQ